MKVSSWVDFRLSNTQAWVRNITPPQISQVRNFPHEILVVRRHTIKWIEALEIMDKSIALSYYELVV